MAASAKQRALGRHVARLRKCRLCPRMKSTPVSGGAIVSDVMIIGQAPGPREPTLKRPFAHTAGQTLFRCRHQRRKIEKIKLNTMLMIMQVTIGK